MQTEELKIVYKILENIYVVPRPIILHIGKTLRVASKPIKAHLNLVPAINKQTNIAIEFQRGTHRQTDKIKQSSQREIVGLLTGTQ